VKVKILPLAAGILFVVLGAAFLFGQDAAPPAKPEIPSKEVQDLKTQVHQLTLQNEQIQIQNFTIQMQQLNAAYTALVNKMVAENPGTVWDPAHQQLMLKAAKQVPSPPVPAQPAAKSAPAKPAAK